MFIPSDPRMLEAAISLISALPAGTYVDDVALQGEAIIVSVQSGRSTVTAIRQAFPGTIWAKVYNKGCQWWEWSTALQGGTTLRIYGDHNGPAACTKRTETRTRTEKVAVAFEDREVEYEHIIWDCPEVDQKAPSRG